MSHKHERWQHAHWATGWPGVPPQGATAGLRWPWLSLPQPSRRLSSLLAHSAQAQADVTNALCKAPVRAPCFPTAFASQRYSLETGAGVMSLVQLSKVTVRLPCPSGPPDSSAVPKNSPCLNVLTACVKHHLPAN